MVTLYPYLPTFWGIVLPCVSCTMYFHSVRDTATPAADIKADVEYLNVALFYRRDNSFQKCTVSYPCQVPAPKPCTGDNDFPKSCRRHGI